VAVLVHLVGVAIWLGGLVFLAAVVLPRRRSDEVRVLLPRFSRVAFGAVSAMVVAGAVMVTRVVPKLTDLPHTGYGRMLLLKLAFVALLLVAAQQARTFTERKLVRDSTRLRPLLTAVGVELTLAVVILTSTAVLVGRVPPSTRTNRIATPSVTAPNELSTPKGR
jgi:putative copper export protein